MDEMEIARQSLYSARLFEIEFDDDELDLIDEHGGEFYRVEVTKGGKHVKTLRLRGRSQAHAVERAKEHYPGHYISSVSKVD
jgi:hypothetical protein